MKRILITRSRAQAGAFAAGLKAAGFEPFFFPVIEIRPMQDNTALERALCRLACYDWLIFTSSNAVEMVWKVPNFQSIPNTVRVAAIGPKTASALREHAVEPTFVPDEYVAEAILPGLGDLRGCLVLLPCAEIARKDLPEAIGKAGGVAHEIAIYQTLPAEPDLAGLSALMTGVEVVTLTSPSCVENFVALAHRHGLDPLNLRNQPAFACIGPITAQAAREAGLPNLIVADEYSTDGLIRVIQDL